MNIITDDIGDVVERMRPYADNEPNAPYYMYGMPGEINNRLVDKDKGKRSAYQKYPLVALRLDIEEEVGSNGLVSYNLNLAFLTRTEMHLNAEERMEKVIKPKLVPLYERFLVELRNLGYFQWEMGTVLNYVDENENEKQLSVPPHRRVIRPYYGTQDSERNVKQKFNDPLDAIEIINLQIKQKHVTRSLC